MRCGTFSPFTEWSLLAMNGNSRPSGELTKETTTISNSPEVDLDSRALTFPTFSFLQSPYFCVGNSSVGGERR
jgi:hypothetical protein